MFRKSIGLMGVAALSLAAADAFAAHGAGNGGGGIIRDGKYLTFGSAQVQVRPKPTEDIPGLTLLQEAILKMPLDDAAQGILLSAIAPIGPRQYFEVAAEDLSSDARKKFVKAYVKALNQKIDASKIVIYAYTAGGETFLLPEFFKLEKVQQATLLFHEALWVINPKLDYSSVIDAEIAFEYYLRKSGSSYGYESHLFSLLEGVLGVRNLNFISAAIDDHREGRFAPFLDENGALPFGFLFGDGNFTETIGAQWIVPGATADLAAYIQKMILSHPDLKIFQALAPVANCVTIHNEGFEMWGFAHERERVVTEASIAPWALNSFYAKYHGRFFLGRFTNLHNSQGQNVYLDFICDRTRDHWFAERIRR